MTKDNATDQQMWYTKHMRQRVCLLPQSKGEDMEKNEGRGAVPIQSQQVGAHPPVHQRIGPVSLSAQQQRRPCGVLDVLLFGRCPCGPFLLTLHPPSLHSQET